MATRTPLIGSVIFSAMIAIWLVLPDGDGTTSSAASIPTVTQLASFASSPIAARNDDRMLFSASADPADATSQRDASVTPVATLPAEPPQPPAIVGVIERSGGGGLVLARMAGGPVRQLKRGDRIGDWTLIGFRGEKASFRIGDRVEIVALDRTNKAGSSQRPGNIDMAGGPERED